MAENSRPANVHVPRSVQFRMDVRRALQSGKKDDLVEVAKKYDVAVPRGASVQDVRRALTTSFTVAGAGNAAAPEAAPAAGGA